MNVKKLPVKISQYIYIYKYYHYFVAKKWVTKSSISNRSYYFSFMGNLIGLFWTFNEV